ncbi:hypothetical protein N8563_00610 [bacterium]|nr:hypothetical protein [bacterium]
MTIVSSIQGYRVLLYLGEILVISRRNQIFVSDYYFRNKRFICELPLPHYFYSALTRVRLLQRLLRLQPSSTCRISESAFLITFLGSIYRVDVLNCTCCQETSSFFPVRIKPLCFCRPSKSQSPGEILFGDYTPNPTLLPVNVYRRDPSGDYSVVFTFPANSINHVHGIFEDPYCSSLLILTGDFDDSACIWKTDYSFSSVSKIASFGQLSRCCWIVPTPNEYLYATDQQSSFNYFCSLSKIPFSCPTRLFPIPGSSIYHSESHNDFIVFSTVLEPSSFNNPSFFDLFSSIPAIGMIGNQCFVYVGNSSIGFQVIFSATYDNLPFRLFQFPSVVFPSGNSTCQNLLHFYCSGLVGYDDKSLLVSLA